MMEITSGIEAKPYRIAIYGPPGVGKSTAANSAKRPIFLNIEDALHHVDCFKTSLISSTQDLRDAVKIITTDPKFKDNFDTICLDTIDALEDILTREICERHGQESLGSFGFGKGYDLLNKEWLNILEGLNIISRRHNKNIILVGHDQIKRFEDPLGDGYDRVVLKMHHKSALSLVSKVDAVLYMTWNKVIRKSETGVRKAIGTGDRVVHTEESPAFMAKNRYGFDKKLDANQNLFKELEQQIKDFHTQEQTLEMVND